MWGGDVLLSFFEPPADWQEELPVIRPPADPSEGLGVGFPGATHLIGEGAFSGTPELFLQVLLVEPTGGLVI